MEESVNRRERLKAMRKEAEVAEDLSIQCSKDQSSNLSNPFLSAVPSQSLLLDIHPSSRFDFYTDPMSAFSSGKKRNNDGNLHCQSYYSPKSERSPTVQGISTPNQAPYETPRQYRMPISSSSGSRRGQGSARSRGSHEDFSAKESPQLYYKKSMVLDPWMHLKPVVRSSTVSSNNPMSLLKSPASWLPKSLSADKAKSSGSSSMTLRPKSRLAECLSFAFEEAVKETDDC